MAKTSGLEQALAALRKEKNLLEAQLGRVGDALAALSGGVQKEYRRRRRTRQVKTVVTNVRSMSAAQRKSVSDRMKKYWAGRKAKAAATSRKRR